MTLRIVFMGTPDFSVPTLAEILGAGHEVIAAYTQPPRPAGRGMVEKPSPVQIFAERADIPVNSPKSLRREPEQQAFAALRPDAAVVVAYGLLLPRRCSPRRVSAASACTPPRCRAGAVRRRSSAPSWRAIAKPR